MRFGLLLIATAVVLVGCGSSGTSDADAAAKPTKPIDNMPVSPNKPGLASSEGARAPSPSQGMTATPPPK